MSTQRHAPDCEVIIRTELPPLPAEGKARLRKLIAFLEELPKERFNFGIIINECNTVGCAMGWLPAVFPDLVEWNKNFGIHLIGDRPERDNAFNAAAGIFHTPGDTACDLFQPLSQKQVHQRLPKLPYDSAPSAVAAMLTQYIALTETPVP